MKEHPIIFNRDMVKAILDGRKTQTRRVIKGKPNKIFWNSIVYNGYAGWTDEHGKPFCCPYGVPGDKLWMRETFAYTADYTGNDPGCFALMRGCFYRADYPEGDCIEDEIKRWRPSIHLPRRKSRIDLEVINIRVEQVQDISKEDSVAESVDMGQIIYREGDDTHNLHRKWLYENYGHPMANTRVIGEEDLFHALWDSINAKRGYGWDTNPWVWVIEFRRVK